MAVIAVYSVKGGVGKTTLAVDLAWRFAVRGGHRSLIWDLDLQGGAGFLLGDDPLVRRNAASLFHREGKPRQLARPTLYGNLSLISADDSLRQLPLQLARIGPRRRLVTMTSLLRADYDRIVLDCPAGLSEISEEVLAAADLIIVPLPPSPLARRALDLVRRELLRQHGRHPPILPVLSMIDMRRRLHREIVEGEGRGWPIIPMASVIERSTVLRRPVGSFAMGSVADRALDHMWAGIEAKIREMTGEVRASPAPVPPAPAPSAARPSAPPLAPSRPIVVRASNA